MYIHTNFGKDNGQMSSIIFFILLVDYFLYVAVGGGVKVLSIVHVSTC